MAKVAATKLPKKNSTMGHCGCCCCEGGEAVGSLSLRLPMLLLAERFRLVTFAWFFPFPLDLLLLLPAMVREKVWKKRDCVECSVCERLVEFKGGPAGLYFRRPLPWSNERERGVRFAQPRWCLGSSPNSLPRASRPWPPLTLRRLPWLPRPPMLLPAMSPPKRRPQLFQHSK